MPHLILRNVASLPEVWHRDRPGEPPIIAQLALPSVARAMKPSTTLRVALSIRCILNYNERFAGTPEEEEALLALPPSIVVPVDVNANCDYHSRPTRREYFLTAANPVVDIAYRIRDISASHHKRRFVVHFEAIPNQFDAAVANLGGVDAPPLLVKTKGDIAKVRALLKEQAVAASRAAARLGMDVVSSVSLQPAMYPRHGELAHLAQHPPEALLKALTHPRAQESDYGSGGGGADGGYGGRSGAAASGAGGGGGGQSSSSSFAAASSSSHGESSYAPGVPLGSSSGGNGYLSEAAGLVSLAEGSAAAQGAAPAAAWGAAPTVQLFSPLSVAAAGAASLGGAPDRPASAAPQGETRTGGVAGGPFGRPWPAFSAPGDQSTLQHLDQLWGEEPFTGGGETEVAEAAASMRSASQAPSGSGGAGGPTADLASEDAGGGSEGEGESMRSGAPETGGGGGGGAAGQWGTLYPRLHPRPGQQPYELQQAWPQGQGGRARVTRPRRLPPEIVAEATSAASDAAEAYFSAAVMGAMGSGEGPLGAPTSRGSRQQGSYDAGPSFSGSAYAPSSRRAAASDRPPTATRQRKEAKAAALAKSSAAAAAQRQSIYGTRYAAGTLPPSSAAAAALLAEEEDAMDEEEEYEGGGAGGGRGRDSATRRLMRAVVKRQRAAAEAAAASEGEEDEKEEQGGQSAPEEASDRGVPDNNGASRGAGPAAQGPVQGWLRRFVRLAGGGHAPTAAAAGEGRDRYGQQAPNPRGKRDRGERESRAEEEEEEGESVDGAGERQRKKKHTGTADASDPWLPHLHLGLDALLSIVGEPSAGTPAGPGPLSSPNPCTALPGGPAPATAAPASTAAAAAAASEPASSPTAAAAAEGVLGLERLDPTAPPPSSGAPPLPREPMAPPPQQPPGHSLLSSSAAAAAVDGAGSSDTTPLGPFTYLALLRKGVGAPGGTSGTAEAAGGMGTVPSSGSSAVGEGGVVVTSAGGRTAAPRPVPGGGASGEVSFPPRGPGSASDNEDEDGGRLHQRGDAAPRVEGARKRASGAGKAAADADADGEEEEEEDTEDGGSGAQASSSASSRDDPSGPFTFAADPATHVCRVTLRCAGPLDNVPESVGSGAPSPPQEEPWPLVALLPWSVAEKLWSDMQEGGGLQGQGVPEQGGMAEGLLAAVAAAEAAEEEGEGEPGRRGSRAALPPRTVSDAEEQTLGGTIAVGQARGSRRGGGLEVASPPTWARSLEPSPAEAAAVSSSSSSAAAPAAAGRPSVRPTPAGSVPPGSERGEVVGVTEVPRQSLQDWLTSTGRGGRAITRVFTTTVAPKHPSTTIAKHNPPRTASAATHRSTAPVEVDASTLQQLMSRISGLEASVKQLKSSLDAKDAFLDDLAAAVTEQGGKGMDHDVSINALLPLLRLFGDAAALLTPGEQLLGPRGGGPGARAGGAVAGVGGGGSAVFGGRPPSFAPPAPASAGSHSSQQLAAGAADGAAAAASAAVGALEGGGGDGRAADDATGSTSAADSSSSSADASSATPPAAAAAAAGSAVPPGNNSPPTAPGDQDDATAAPLPPTPATGADAPGPVAASQPGSAPGNSGPQAATSGGAGGGAPWSKEPSPQLELARQQLLGLSHLLQAHQLLLGPSQSGQFFQQQVQLQQLLPFLSHTGVQAAAGQPQQQQQQAQQQQAQQPLMLQHGPPQLQQYFQQLAPPPQQEFRQLAPQQQQQQFRQLAPQQQLQFRHLQMKQFQLQQQRHYEQQQLLPQQFPPLQKFQGPQPVAGGSSFLPGQQGAPGPRVVVRPPAPSRPGLYPPQSFASAQATAAASSAAAAAAQSQVPAGASAAPNTPWGPGPYLGSPSDPKAPAASSAAAAGSSSHAVATAVAPGAGTPGTAAPPAPVGAQGAAMGPVLAPHNTLRGRPSRSRGTRGGGGRGGGRGQGLGPALAPAAAEGTSLQQLQHDIMASLPPGLTAIQTQAWWKGMADQHALLQVQMRMQEYMQQQRGEAPGAPGGSDASACMMPPPSVPRAGGIATGAGGSTPGAGGPGPAVYPQQDRPSTLPPTSSAASAPLGAAMGAAQSASAGAPSSFPVALVPQDVAAVVAVNAKGAVRASSSSSSRTVV